MTAVKTRRPYRSTIRRGDAPRAILSAAHRLFSVSGYLATSIDDIAAEAGVARPTVFSAVGPKAVILKIVFDQAMAGDDAPVPLADRPWFREALDHPDPAQSLRLHARNIRAICDRVADLQRSVENAATVDPDARALWADYQVQRRAGMRNFAHHLAEKGGLRQDAQLIADTLWTIVPDTYLRLVRDRGWSPDRYEEWLGDTLCRLFLA